MDETGKSTLYLTRKEQYTMNDKTLTINRDMKIIVDDCKPGLYRFTTESANGKSYLYSLAKQYREYGEPIDAFTFSDYKRGKKIADYIGQGLKLFVIDRYDLYNGEQSEDIVKLSKDCFVIIDCKLALNLNQHVPFKLIHLDKGRIVIE